MSDLSSSPNSEPLDPKRPWITDPREAPASMNWLQGYVNPFGETSRLHFTRAWTGLFFIRLIWYLGFWLLAAIFGAAGVENSSAFVPPPWAFLVLIVVTVMASLVLHVRRLADAKRSPLWAVLVVIPALALLFGLVSGVQNSAAEYGVAQRAADLERQGMPRKLIAVELDRNGAAKLFAQELLVRVELGQLERGEISADEPDQDLLETADLSDPAFTTALVDMSAELTGSQRTKIENAFEDLRTEKAEEQSDSESGSNSETVGAQAGGERTGRGGPNQTREQRLRGQLGRFSRQWRGKLPQIDVSTISERDYALDAGVGTATVFWAIPSFLVMLWSLLWVGRLPSGGGTIRSRFEPETDLESRSYAS